jgi:hypothetical protein
MEDVANILNTQSYTTEFQIRSVAGAKKCKKQHLNYPQGFGPEGFFEMNEAKLV